MELSNEEKERVYSILTNMKLPSLEDRKRATNRCILLVDGNNLFLRSWNAMPDMDVNGNHIGGIVGSLKSIGYTIKLVNPTRCVIIFDGVGGSFKRRQIYPNYKEQRKGRIRLNRMYEDLTDAKTEEENRNKQYIRLINYLQVLPVNMLSIDHVEADDVIAYLALQYFKDSDKVYIMSTDKDFLQLCTENIRVYSPTKKRLYGIAEVVQDYQIHPNNFVLYRAINGDESDNINGIPGAGPKTIVKHFPWLNETINHTVDEIINHATNLRNKYKACNAIAEGKLIIERNIQLMQLKDTMLSATAQLHCNECLANNKIPNMERGTFLSMVRDDRLESSLPNHISWLNEVFNPLNSVVRE
jgi:DNA polymerase I